MWELLLLVPVTVAYILLRRVVVQYFDRRRIQAFLYARGSRLEDIDIAFSAAGWGDNEDGRTYTVRLIGPEGNRSELICRTSLFGGVYFKNDPEGFVRLNISHRQPRSASR